MDFRENGFMYALGFMIVIFVLGQSLFFLVRAWKRGKEIGLSTQSMKNAVIQSSLFSMTPALSIVATVLALSSALGLVIPWIRLSVIGNITYETAAAEAAVNATGHTGGLSQAITDPAVFSTVIWVMTLGCILPLIIIPIFLKKIQKSMGKVVAKDKKWADSMSAAAFIGLICAFVGRALVGQGEIETIGDGAGVLSVLALVSSVGFMLLFQWIGEKRNSRFLQSFAMPVSMYIAMIVVVIAAQILPDSIAFFEFRG